MPQSNNHEAKSLIFVVGGSPTQRGEIAQNLKSFYMFKLFDDRSQILDALSSTTPTALVVDEALPPKGGGKFYRRST